MLWLDKYSESVFSFFIELNNIEFHCGKAEDIVPSLINILAPQNLITIVDPPRAGLRKFATFYVLTLFSQSVFGGEPKQAPMG